MPIRQLTRLFIRGQRSNINEEAAVAAVNNQTKIICLLHYSKSMHSPPGSPRAQLGHHVPKQKSVHESKSQKTNLYESCHLLKLCYCK
jgi:hypothetical protein